MCKPNNTPPLGWKSYNFHYTTSYTNLGLNIERKDLPKFESTEPVIGYRVWKLQKETTLRSCYKETTWPFREKFSRSADENLNLGIHAMKDYKSLLQNADSNPIDLFPSVGLWSDYHADVAGEVWLWGEVKECQYGYLAEFAYPKKLWLPEHADPVTVMQLEENYGVPVELNPDLNEYKKSWWDVAMNTQLWVSTMAQIMSLPLNSEKPEEKGII